MEDATLVRPESLVIADVIRRRWRRIFLVAAAAAVLGFVATFLITPTYRSVATLIPQGGADTGSGILGSLFDTSLLPSGSKSFEPYYEEMVHSDQILDTVIARRWPSGESTADSLTLQEQWKIDDEDDHVRANRLKERLRQEVVALRVDKGSRIMRLECTVPGSPVLARALADHILRELDELVQAMRRRDAREQSLFLEERLDTIEASLGRASDALTAFLEQNRRYTESPQLLRQYADLEREVQAQTTIWVELRRQLEISRVEENKSLAALQILDPPTLPVDPAGPDRVTAALVGAILGGFLALSVLTTRRMKLARST